MTFLIIALVFVLTLTISSSVQAYRQFRGHNDSVRMDYSTVKKLYRVNPQRWGYNKSFYMRRIIRDLDSFYTMKGLYYNSTPGCKASWEGSYEQFNSCLHHVSLSYIDWIHFILDYLRHEWYMSRARKKREMKELSIRNSENLSKILSSAQKDIDDLIQKSNREIQSSIEVVKSIDAERGATS